VVLLQPPGRGLQPLRGVVVFRHLRDQFGGGDLRVGRAGRGVLQPMHRPAAQRGDHGPVRVTGNRPEASQQRHQPAEPASARPPGAPHRRGWQQVHIVGVTKIIGLFQHRLP